MRGSGGFVFAVAVILLSLSGRGAVAATQGGDEQLDFAIVRNGETIGHDIFRFRRDDDRLTVQITTEIVVKIISIPVYRLEHREQESWVGDRLQSLSSFTDDDGTVRRFEGKATEGGITVYHDGHQIDFPPDIVPGSLWNPRMLAASQVINATDGSKQAITVRDLGEQRIEVRHAQVSAHHYIVSGAFERELWFDEARTLVKVRFKARDSSEIVYELR